MSRDYQQEQSNALRAQLRQTVQILNQLAQSERDFDRFCGEALTRLTKLTGAYGALLWQINGGSQLMLTHQAGDHPNETARAITSAENQQHARVLIDVLTEQKPVGISSEAFQKAETLDGAESDPPVTLLLSPLMDRSGQSWGAIELLQRGGITPQAQEGYILFLTSVAQAFERWHEQSDFARLTENADQWHGKLEYVTEVHRHLNVTETCFAIANEARRLLGCDRVSVARWNGSRCKVVAISGQDRFDNRANVVKKLQNICTSSVSADSPFWVIGDTEGLAPDVARQINEYLDEAHSRTLIVLPLAIRPSSQPDLEMNKRAKEARKLGALVVEYFDADIKEDQIAEKRELIVSQAELALENSRKHSEVFLLPIFERLGVLQQTLFRDHFAKSMTGLAALGLLTLLMIFFPKELKMKAEGVMRPSVRQTVFAQVDGSIINEVLVDEQTEVQKDDVLIRMANPDLSYQIAEIAGRIQTTQRQREIVWAQGTRTEPTNDPTYQRSNTDLNDVELLDSQLEILKLQLSLLKEKEQRLEIKSPVSGVVITPQPKRRLTNLPTNSNMAVLEIVDNKGRWELDLKIPQNRIGYVTKAMEGRSEPLDVEFRLGTNPNIVLTGKLVSVSNRAVPTQAGSTEYKALVDADGEQFRKLTDELRTGAGVTAKIHCGTRSLGFVCFYQIIDWLRTHVFF